MLWRSSWVTIHSQAGMSKTKFWTTSNHSPALWSFLRAEGQPCVSFADIYSIKGKDPSPVPVQGPSTGSYCRGNWMHKESRRTSLVTPIASCEYGGAPMTEMMDVQCSWVILEAGKRRCSLAKTIQARVGPTFCHRAKAMSKLATMVGRIPVLCYEC